MNHQKAPILYSLQNNLDLEISRIITLRLVKT